jgi:hypothetical protein
LWFSSYLQTYLERDVRAPEVFAFVRSRIDRQPRRTGQWLLSGSQEAPLMQGVTESMAGRAAVLQLLPFSTRETPKVTMLRGGYPEAVARPGAARLVGCISCMRILKCDFRLLKHRIIVKLAGTAETRAGCHLFTYLVPAPERAIGSRLLASRKTRRKQVWRRFGFVDVWFSELCLLANHFFSSGPGEFLSGCHVVANGQMCKMT